MALQVEGGVSMENWWSILKWVMEGLAALSFSSVNHWMQLLASYNIASFVRDDPHRKRILVLWVIWKLQRIFYILEMV